MIKEISRRIHEEGGNAFIVGGFVRDSILNRESKDIDVEVYGLEPERLESILAEFGKVKYCGESFGVFKLNEYDFSMPRKERKNGTGYKGFDIHIDPFMSIEEASRRRDLTINAMLMNPITGEIIDPFNGMQDLKEGTIKHVDSMTFAEDPLRVLRVAQFSARFNFGVHSETKELCIKLLPEMKTLSKERFFVELEKILMKAEKPSIAFRFMLETGVLDTLFPELAVLNTIEQGTKHHREGNVFEHTMLAVDSIPVKDRRLDLMLAVLTHDMGKAVCPIIKESEEIIHFYGHGEEGTETVRTFISRFTNETDLTETVVNLTKYHMSPFELKKNLHKASVRRLALKVDIEDLMVIHLADLKGRYDYRDTSHIERIITVFEEVRNEIKPFIMGRDLINFGLNPSKEFGAILKTIFEAQIEGVFTDRENGLIFTENMLREKALI